MKHIIPALTALSFLLLAPFVQADDWKNKVNKEISSKIRYPSTALRQGIEGTVLVRVTVAKNGSILGFVTEKSSGNAILDHNTLSLLSRVNPLPPLMDGSEQKSFSIPLVYALPKGMPKVVKKTTVKATAVPSTMAEWKVLLGERIADHQSYPTSALKRRIQGDVQMALYVNPDGTITGFNVSKSSGHTELDQAASDAVATLGKMPAIPRIKKARRFIIPINFRLK